MGVIDRRIEQQAAERYARAKDLQQKSPDQADHRQKNPSGYALALNRHCTSSPRKTTQHQRGVDQ